jgi:hypothetical protein
MTANADGCRRLDSLFRPPCFKTWLIKLNSIYNKNILLKYRTNNC